MANAIERVMKWLMVGLLAIGVTLAHAQLPKTINYQGFLASNTGVPVNAPANTPQPMTFSLFLNLTDPPNTTPLWSETQNVTVTNGVFNVVLGTGNFSGRLCAREPAVYRAVFSGNKSGGNGHTHAASGAQRNALCNSRGER